MQPLAGIAHQLGQPGLDVQVHVLELELPLEAALFDLLADLCHAALDVGQVLRSDDAARGQHAGMGQAAVDIGTPQPLVEAHAGGVALDELAHRFREQGRPGLGLLVELIAGHGLRGVARAHELCATDRIILGRHHGQVLTPFTHA